MAGHVSIGKLAATGWAVHPRLPDYRVLVHVISGARILRSVVANQAPLGAGADSKSWFNVDLGSLELSKSELRTLLFYVAETGEWLESGTGVKPASGQQITLESMLASKRANPWVNGGTYMDVGDCLTEWEIIDLFYRDFLGRPADDKGLSEYVRQLQEGALTLEGIRGNILSSQEYASRRKDAGRPPGAVFSDPLVRSISDARRRAGVVPRVATDAHETLSGWQTAPDEEPDGQGQESLPNVSEIDSPADSPVFGAGWHAAELIGGKAFRWMSRSALIQNPRPDLPMRNVTVHVAAVYGSRAPMIECYLDDAPASARVVRSGGGFVIEISPSGAHSGRFASLRINSQAAGSPVRDGVGRDDRVLSLNVLRVVSCYHAGGSRPAASYTSERSGAAGRLGLRRALRVLQSLTGLAK
jgi:hypothetical protein